MRKILVVDDDPLIHEITRTGLQADGLEVISAANGREGLRQLYKHKPDLVVLDIMMPEMDGWETCRQIRMLSNVPVILLTSLSEESNVIKGLDSGADDFVGKPFNIDLLRSRIRAVLRRVHETAPGVRVEGYQDDFLEINFDDRAVIVNGQKIELTRIEYRLLEYLIRNKGRTLTYDEILNHVWGWEYQDSPDYVHVYISHLRRKIEKELKTSTYFQTVYGIGYRFEAMTV